MGSYASTLEEKRRANSASELLEEIEEQHRLSHSGLRDHRHERSL